jgi:hypothetical protein
MKRIACVVMALMTVVSVSQAQLKFGIKAGANVNNLTTDVSSMLNEVKGATNYQFGVLFQAKALGFVVQPEVLYVTKSSMISNSTITSLFSGADVEYKTQNIEVPINLQYGFSFIVGRVFLQAGPYVSFVASTFMNGEENFNETLKNSMSTFDYGVGAGAGVELLGFQLAAKYDWGLGKLGDAKIGLLDNPFNDMQHRTLNVSLAYLF